MILFGTGVFCCLMAHNSRCSGSESAEVNKGKLNASEIAELGLSMDAEAKLEFKSGDVRR